MPAHDVPEPRFIEVGKLPKPSPAPPEDLVWLRVVEFLRARELADSTRKAYERQLQQFYAWSSQKPWDQITHRDIDRYKLHLKRQISRFGEALAPATINQALATLKSFFKWLTVKDYITRNPTLTVELVQEPPKPPADLAQGQVERALKAA
ncbi:MAG: phage integrase N-terminal SAM-like domain-containing protein, partial [Cyanobacteria bacterium P01_A01_bin.17]